ncbi:MAG: bifunctional methylenetetrahydrofolate dehydrogenase/methenyltetrahydrofolate cyclohydrolase, partial [Gammaproteobacteria bacterium]|nr:bifunctional methylenetetrahydrofolate dehydrogenase/methenyltetrahydrofolate cyclohydrolase [Gammaproteobacteria bacterium]
MSAQIIDGKQIAAELSKTLKIRVNKRLEAGLRKPGLAVILVGSDPASEVYVRNKRKGCEDAGIESLAYDLPDDTTEQKLLDLIDALNTNDAVDGILVQLPLPSHI